MVGEYIEKDTANQTLIEFAKAKNYCHFNNDDYIQHNVKIPGIIESYAWDTAWTQSTVYPNHYDNILTDEGVLIIDVGTITGDIAHTSTKGYFLVFDVFKISNSSFDDIVVGASGILNPKNAATRYTIVLDAPETVGDYYKIHLNYNKNHYKDDKSDIYSANVAAYYYSYENNNGVWPIPFNIDYLDLSYIGLPLKQSYHIEFLNYDNFNYTDESDIDHIITYEDIVSVTFSNYQLYRFSTIFNNTNENVKNLFYLGKNTDSTEKYAINNNSEFNESDLDSYLWLKVEYKDNMPKQLILEVY